MIRQEYLKEVMDALILAGAPGMTVTRVEGFGSQRVRIEPFLKPKAKIEIYADDSEVENFINVISDTVRSGKMGDGKIAVLDIEDLVRIRTGERKKKALY